MPKVVGGKVDVLGEAKALVEVQEVHSVFTFRGVNVEFEIAEE